MSRLASPNRIRIPNSLFNKEETYECLLCKKNKKLSNFHPFFGINFVSRRKTCVICLETPEAKRKRLENYKKYPENKNKRKIRYKAYYQKNKEMVLEKQRERNKSEERKKYLKNYHQIWIEKRIDAYSKSRLKMKYGLSDSEITPEIVNLQKQSILIHRKKREILNK